MGPLEVFATFWFAVSIPVEIVSNIVFWRWLVRRRVPMTLLWVGTPGYLDEKFRRWCGQKGRSPKRVLFLRRLSLLNAIAAGVAFMVFVALPRATEGATATGVAGHLPSDSAAAVRFVENGVGHVAFGDYRSGSLFLEAHNQPAGNGDGVYTFKRADASGGILELVTFEGGSRGVFDQARLSILPPENRPEATLPAEYFVSSLGIRAGLAIEDVTAILGPPMSSQVTGGTTTLRYACREERCPFLSRVGQIGYEAELKFTDGRLVDYLFGYELP
jgi:hypothetical protein